MKRRLALRVCHSELFSTRESAPLLEGMIDAMSIELLRVLACEALAFVFFFLYGSFFEWAFHKYLFHSPKFIKSTFQAHTIVHHQVYKYEPDSYEWREGKKEDPNKVHISMNWFALPMFLGVHAPIFWVLENLTHIPLLIGGLAAIGTYYVVYEYFHYFMHVPARKGFENTEIFQFVKEHHRIHHKYMLQNLNVFFPLADLCLGTYRSPQSVGVAKVRKEVVLKNETATQRTVAPKFSGKSAAEGK